VWRMAKVPEARAHPAGRTWAGPVPRSPVVSGRPENARLLHGFPGFGPNEPDSRLNVFSERFVYLSETQV
jgi:hypothetical protein